MPKFGELLKEDRERLLLSQDQLAERLGVSQQAVSRWEDGHSMPRRSRMQQIRKVLGGKSNIEQALRNAQQEDGLPSTNPQQSMVTTEETTKALLAQAAADIATATSQIAKAAEKIAEVLQRLTPPRHH